MRQWAQRPICWLMATGLSALSLLKLKLRQAHENRLAVAHLEPGLDAAADDLLRRDAVDALAPLTQELDAAARDDEVLEPVGAQVGEQFEHRLVGHFGEEPAGLRMLRGGDPILDDPPELHGGHARVGGHDDFEQRLVAGGERGPQVPLEQRGERFRGLPLGVLRRKGLHTVECEVHLHGHRLLAPERPVVVEGGDSFGDGDKRWRAFRCHLLDEAEDALLGRPVVPGWKRVGGQGRVCGRQRTGHDFGRRVFLQGSLPGVLTSTPSTRAETRATDRSAPGSAESARPAGRPGAAPSLRPMGRAGQSALAASRSRITASRLNEAGFCRGGNLTKFSIMLATTPCIR